MKSIYLILCLCLSVGAQTTQFSTSGTSRFSTNGTTRFYQAPVVISGPSPVGQWKFNDASGTTAADASGNGNPGTLHGTNPGLPTWGTGPNGNGDIVFSSSSVHQYVDMGSSATIRPTAAGSISCWAKNSGNVGGFQCICGDGNETSDLNGVDVYIGSGIVAAGEICNASTRNTITGSTVFTGANWYFIVLTWDGTHVNLYVNGVSDTAQISQTVTPTPAFPFCVGSDGNHLGQFKSEVDDVRVYNTALTSGQVATLYSAGAQ